ncbi:hypothetical protein Plhal304r1_c020g0070861 [Plasmopara halstedii]
MQPCIAAGNRQFSFRIRVNKNMYLEVLFKSEACRVWTGMLGTPLHVIEDAEQHEVDVVPFSLQIWLRSQLDVDAQSTTQPGLYLAHCPTFDIQQTPMQLNQSLFLPADTLSCFSIYSPSPFVSNVLVVVDVNDSLQQGYVFGRVQLPLPQLELHGITQSSDERNRVLSKMEAVEELLVALVAAFPTVPLSSTAKQCLAKRELEHQSAGIKIIKISTRRKALPAKAFYGTADTASLDSALLADAKWRSFYEKLQFRVSRSLTCQLEGTAPISSSFPRQQEAFEFADQVAVSQRKIAVFSGKSSLTENSIRETPRIFSFEDANNGKRRFFVSSFAEFWKKYTATRNDERHVYEIIRDGVPCRLYFDLEFKRRINVHVDGDALVARLVSLLQLQLFRCYRLYVARQDIYELDSSTPDKFSRHLIIHLPDGSLFMNNLHAGSFVREFIRDLAAVHVKKHETSDGLLSPFLVNTESAGDSVDKKQLFIDMSVYTRNRMFRVLGSSKYKKKSVLRLLGPFAGPKLDQELFEKTLVCPFPSCDLLKSDLKSRNHRLLRCRSSVTPLGRSRNISTSSIECQKSVYPELDSFIRSQANKGGVQGEIRAIQMLLTSKSTKPVVKATEAEIPGQVNSIMQPYAIVYHMALNRWCANIQRAHKSNNIMYIVDIQQRVFYQKCHDPLCQAMDFRSPPQSLPQYISFSLTEKKVI